MKDISASDSPGNVTKVSTVSIKATKMHVVITLDAIPSFFFYFSDVFLHMTRSLAQNTMFVPFQIR